MRTATKNNLVEQIAKMLDTEGAFAEFFDLTDPEAKPMPPTTRQKYFQARYKHTAVMILDMLLNISHDKIKEDLVEYEKRMWQELGLDLNKPEIKDMANKLIQDKYDSAFLDFNTNGVEIGREYGPGEEIVVWG